MDKLFQKYADAFDALDANGIADLYMIPCSAFDGDGANVFPERKSLVEKLTKNCATMKSMGYKYSEFNRLDTTALGETAKAVTLGWRVHTASSVLEFRTLYVCHKIADTWRVFSANVYPGSFH
jgi:ketosteroid isomerase-like protein